MTQFSNGFLTCVQPNLQNIFFPHKTVQVNPTGDYGVISSNVGVPVLPPSNGQPQYSQHPCQSAHVMAKQICPWHQQSFPTLWMLDRRLDASVGIHCISHLLPWHHSGSCVWVTKVDFCNSGIHKTRCLTTRAHFHSSH